MTGSTRVRYWSKKKMFLVAHIIIRFILGRIFSFQLHMG